MGGHQDTSVEGFAEFLRERGLRLTRERGAIYERVLSMKGHFDPEEFLFKLKDEGASVSRASVYRTLPLLVDAGVLEQVQRTDNHGHAHYECTVGRRHHDHMLCLSCGRVIEFFSSELEEVQDRLCKARGFRGVAHTLEVRGYCRDCTPPEAES